MGEFQKPPNKTISNGKAMQAYLEWYPGVAGTMERAYGTGGKLQMFVDRMCVRGFSEYVPMKTSMLRKSATLATVFGSGVVIYRTPYARFQYYGKVMVDPETGSTWARRNGTKVLTNRSLVHSKQLNAKAGPFWDVRAKNDLGPQWTAATQKYIKGGMK